MGEMLINGELRLAYPEGFRELDAGEIAQVFNDGYPDRRGIRDEERHALLIVAWKVSGEKVTKLASTKSLAERAEKLLAKGYRKARVPYGCHGFFESRLCGEEAWGFRYDYAVQGVEQTAETVIFKNGACCYTLQYTTRTANAPENLEAYESILASLTLE